MDGIKTRRCLHCRLFKLSSLFISALAISIITLATCILPYLPNYSTGNLIPLACKATSFHHVCESSLRFSSPSALHSKSSIDIIRIGITLAEQSVQQCHAFSVNLVSISAGNPNMANAARNCEYLTSRSLHLLRKCQELSAISKIKDYEAWMSAVLTWENDCFSALSHVNDTDSVEGSNPKLDNLSGGSHDFDRVIVNDQRQVVGVHDHYQIHGVHGVNQLMHYLNTSISLISNALSMLIAYNLHGSDLSSWSRPSRNTLPGLILTGKKKWDGDESVCNLKPVVTVTKYGHGDFTSIQSAVDQVPENAETRYVIHIEEGVYNETIRIPYTKTSVVFVGDGVTKTVITGNRNAQMIGVTTFDSATVAVDGDRFVACYLTIENTAPPELHQAVALRVSSDLSQFYNCAFLGHQDTLYAHSLRQFYQNCRVEGTIDFVFGNAAAVFKDSHFLVRPGRISSSVIAASGRTDPAQMTGLVFDNCLINGTERFLVNLSSKPKKYKVYLGRPWKMYARTIYMNCVMDRLVSSEGWRPWKGGFALETLFYGEYNNSGLGASSVGRVNWSDQISPVVALHFSAPNFIQGGDNWLS